MTYQIVTKTVRSQPLAAVRRRVRIGDVGSAWKPALDLVWAFLRHQEGLWSGGHNCFVYHQPAPGESTMVVDFGVEVTRPFPTAGEVAHTATCSGEVVMTTHIGGYGRLVDAHEAIRAWCAVTGRAMGGTFWEFYGDWTDDESKLETQVVYVLK